MKQRLRLLLAFFSFFQFFMAGVLLGVVAFPLLRLFVWRRSRYARLASRFLGFIYPSFLFWMRLAGLIRYQRPPLPDFVPDAGAYVLVSNHPTLIDVVFLLGWVPRLSTTVKVAWLRSLIFGPLLRAADYVPGPGMKGDEGGTPALDRMVAKLEQGQPLVVFPEGTRSPSFGLGRFHRGAFEAAVRAGVPILPLYIDARPPGLNKQRFVPDEPIRFEFSWLGVLEVGVADDPRELMKRTRALIEAEHAARHRK
ncbi:MAG: 1-acyl-sn-glycerol-3-phosphate acyltransferase [Deltaproteobacteria bacterium]|nr:1-acyl-sn-glycerol-3-phosphate acyltransferase [Deltaproteobacteria bacterium]